MNPDKPTDMQLRLAERLDIKNAVGMTRAALSRLFTKMLDPAFDDYQGDVLLKIDAAIEAITPKCRYALTLYQHGGKQIVDVLQFEDMHYDEKGIYLECNVPVIDRTEGPAYYVPEWGDKTVEVKIDKILFYRELPADFEDKCQADFSMDRYRQTIISGMEQVRKQMGIEPDVNPIAIPKDIERKAIRSKPKPSASTSKATRSLLLLACLAVLVVLGMMMVFSWRS